MDPRRLRAADQGAGAVGGIRAASPGAFDLHLYPDRSAAVRAIERRDVYGAFVVEDSGLTKAMDELDLPLVVKIPRA